MLSTPGPGPCLNSAKRLKEGRLLLVGCHPRTLCHLQVPVGTLVKEGGKVVADLCRPGEEYIAARGGAGGKGNRFFLANNNRAPVTCTPGQPGQERLLHLELKTMAHAGMVGTTHRGAGLEITPCPIGAPSPGPTPPCAWYSEPCSVAFPGCGAPTLNPKPSSHLLPGWVPQCRKVLAPPSHFECKTRCGRLPVHHLKSPHRDCPLRRPPTNSR